MTRPHPAQTLLARLLLATMVLLLPTLAWSQQQEKPGTARLLAMGKAASAAIIRGDLPALRALLDAGLPVDHFLFGDAPEAPKMAAIHLCCEHFHAGIMKLLLERGANPGLRDGDKKRPIDLALRDNNLELCRLLTREDGDEAQLDGLPRMLWEELLSGDMAKTELLTFVTINGLDPSPEMRKLLNPMLHFGMTVEGVSAMEDYWDGRGTAYRHKKSKKQGQYMEVCTTLQDDFGGPALFYTWSIRTTTGPALAGGGTRGKISKQFGWWVIRDEVSWDE